MALSSGKSTVLIKANGVGDLSAINVATGQHKWTRKLNETTPVGGLDSFPGVAVGRTLVTLHNTPRNGSFIVGLGLDSGHERWRRRWQGSVSLI